MFLFFHSGQNDTNQSYFKGLLFEQMLGKYLERNGYKVKLRRKHNSLEYDLEGEHQVDQRPVHGEAKAHERPISGEILTSFVGKLLPLGITERKTTGLFLATSSLTAEADDYLSGIKNFPIKVLTGEALMREIERSLDLPQADMLSKQLMDRGLHPLTSHVLVTDLGTFPVVLAAANANATPSFFAVFRENGKLLRDDAFLSKAKLNVQELSPLDFLSDSAPAITSQRTIGKGLVVGESWDDFRLPAAPQLFVGRRTILADLTELIERGDEPNILQIKSRSGVGKSSFLAYLDEHFRSKGFTTELHDARDIKSPFDLFNVIQRFTGATTQAPDLKMATDQITAYANGLTGRAVFMVDQFEATFSEPEIFYTYESLLPVFQRHRGKLYLCLARKNDLLTTYDDSKVSLQRLNAISKAFALRDFDINEAAELIDRIGGLSAKGVSPEVKTFVLEFAQGFPWLIKRTMAHIVRLVKKGASQRELFAAGLKLDELFDEELEGLDELERDYLSRIAARLPGNFQQLQREFDEDPLLPRVLDKLTGSRLLRMTGSTYDTYNDVFKEYLVHQKLPEFKPAFIFRLSPTTIFKLFEQIVDTPNWTTDGLQKFSGKSLGTTFNLIRELRNIGLLKRIGENWQIPQAVRDVFNRGQLSEHVRRHLLENAVISDLLAVVAKQGEFSVQNLPGYLRSRFLFIQASQKTWETYAQITTSWVLALKILDIKNENFVLPVESRAEIVSSLGNLTHIKGRRGRLGGPRQSSDGRLFIPQSHWSTVEKAAIALLQQKPVPMGEPTKGLQNLRGFGLIGPEKTLKFSSISQLKELIREFFLKEPYNALWEKINAGDEIFSDVMRLAPASESTVLWRTKVLAHWGRECGLVDQKRFEQARAYAK